MPPFAVYAYLISTVAPASTNFALMLSASSLETASLMAWGAGLSTRSLASFRHEVGQLADNADDLDLLSAGFLEDDVEFGLLFDRLRCCDSGELRATATAGAAARHAKALFKGFYELGELQNGHWIR